MPTRRTFKREERKVKRYIDVRVRVPQNVLGEFIGSVLPWWATVLDFKTFVDKEVEEKPAQKNNGYMPQTNSMVEKVYKRLIKPYWPKELAKELKGKATEASVYNGIYTLRNKGLVRQLADGRYVRSDIEQPQN